MLDNPLEKKLRDRRPSSTALPCSTGLALWVYAVCGVWGGWDLWSFCSLGRDARVRTSELQQFPPSLAILNLELEYLFLRDVIAFALVFKLLRCVALISCQMSLAFRCGFLDVHLVQLIS